MKPTARASFGFLLLGSGLLVAASEAFLRAWARSSGAEHDILARGAFLLGILIPSFATGTAVVLGLLSVLLWPGRALSVRARFFAPVLATAAACLVLYYEPTSTVLGLLLAVADSWGAAGRFFVAGLLALLGAIPLATIRPTVDETHVASV
jgi:hypothetical protein